MVQTTCHRCGYGKALAQEIEGTPERGYAVHCASCDEVYKTGRLLEPRRSPGKGGLRPAASMVDGLMRAIDEKRKSVATEPPCKVELRDGTLFVSMSHKLRSVVVFTDTGKVRVARCSSCGETERVFGEEFKCEGCIGE